MQPERVSLWLRGEKANFHEKALFVKADLAAPFVVERCGSCPSRYASIRCE
jgi:hypothetical protein